MELRVRRGTEFVRLGRRGWFLLLYAAGYVGIANAIVVNVPLRPKLFLFEYMPFWLRFAIWLVGGMMAAISALLGPRAYDKAQIIGYVGLCIPVAIRVVSYIIALILCIFDDEYRHLVISAGVNGLVIFGTMLVTILLVAGWPEPGPEDFLARTRDPNKEVPPSE